MYNTYLLSAEVKRPTADSIHETAISTNNCQICMSKCQTKIIDVNSGFVIEQKYFIFPFK